VEGFLGIKKSTFVFLLSRRKRQDEIERDSFSTDYPNAALLNITQFYWDIQAIFEVVLSSAVLKESVGYKWKSSMLR
jgi:hypothetical protein